uniref:Protocadherin-like wing polarity protein stan n=1 Tax=Macrostomum lignano TaxID=282301 RepID=A0A1I8IPA8_9PLAT
MDVNDNPPEFVRSSLDFSLSESTPVGYEITRLNATSKDDGNNAVIRYQLMDHDNYFSLSATEGTLTVKSALDYERQQVYYLTVKAYDLGEPPLSATAVVTVKVIDENDNAPEFPADGFRVSVKENEPPGTPLSVKVLATDADSGQNVCFGHQLRTAGRSHQPGQGAEGSYTLTVMATDHGSTPFSASTTVKITVLDVNDCVASVRRAEYAYCAAGNVSQQPYMDTGSFLPPDGNLIGVTDCDAPPNGAPFSWSILDGSPRYSISRGRVRAKPGGGYVTGTEKIRVQVCDSGDIIRCNHTTVSIRIVKADSVPPKILAVNMTSNFYYRLQPTVHIGNVQLLHHKPADVQLTLLTHDDLFRLTRQGSIVTRESLPHGTYRLRVRAAYNGLESEQDISVRVNLITDKMIANAAVLRISNESAYAFFYNRLDASLVDYFSSTLGLPVDNVYIVTVQQQDQQLRVRRSADAAADATSPPVARNQPLLVMLSVYDSRAGAYISPAALQRLKLDGLSEKLGRPVAFLTDCPTNPCLNGGRCHLVPEPLPGNDLRVVTAHASFLSPRVRLAPYCACTDGFAGRTCQMSLAACNCRPDQRCHHLPTGHYICLEQDAGANARACADDSGADCASNATVVHLRGAGNLAWSLNESSPASTASGDPAGRSFAVDLEFRMRSLQNQPGPVFAVHWTPNAPQLRDIVISLGQDGALQVAPAVNGRVQPRPWAASRRRVNDGRWHGVRLRLMREAESRVARSEQALRNWTIELLVDSIEPTLRAIPWSDAPTQKRVSTGRAYVGCLGQMRLNGLPLPVSERQQQQAQPGNLPRVSLTSGTEGATTGCSNTYFGTACAVAPCQHAGVCSNTPGGYQCQCASPYIGRQCEINTEPCAESPCLNGATCHQSGRHFTCECPAGLSGSRCEFGIYCGRDVNPCENNARCEESPSGAICHCGGTGYQGPTCGVDVDECSGGGAPAGGGGARSPCGGRGVCVNQPGSYYCNCSLGYSGRSCETFHVPGVDSGSSALLGLSFHEVVAILSSISIILLLALTIFFVVSYCSRRRGGGSGGGVRRRHGKDRHASSSAAAAAAAAAKSGSTLGSGTYRQCSSHDPAEAMALVTLATGETCMVPQRQLDLRHSVPNCYSSEHNLPEAAAVAASYAAYDKPHPPRPFSFYSDTAGTPTRCLTPSCTATISRRPNSSSSSSSSSRITGTIIISSTTCSRRFCIAEAPGSTPDRAPDPLWATSSMSRVHHFGGVGGSVSPAGSHASRQGYHWDTSDWNTGPGNPPDLIPDSPYCLGSYSGSVGPRRPSLQRMLLANPGAYLPQYAGSACDFDEAREDLEEADEEESSRAALLPGSGGGGANSDQMTTSTSTFRGGGGGQQHRRRRDCHGFDEDGRQRQHGDRLWRQRDTHHGGAASTALDVRGGNARQQHHRPPAPGYRRRPRQCRSRWRSGSQPMRLWPELGSLITH